MVLQPQDVMMGGTLVSSIRENADGTFEYKLGERWKSIKADGFAEITWLELWDLINNSSLVPGKFYMITNYQTVYIVDDETRYGP